MKVIVSRDKIIEIYGYINSRQNLEYIDSLIIGKILNEGQNIKIDIQRNLSSSYDLNTIRNSNEFIIGKILSDMSIKYLILDLPERDIEMLGIDMFETVDMYPENSAFNKKIKTLYFDFRLSKSKINEYEEQKKIIEDIINVLSEKMEKLDSDITKRVQYQKFEFLNCLVAVEYITFFINEIVAEQENEEILEDQYLGNNKLKKIFKKVLDSSDVTTIEDVIKNLEKVYYDLLFNFSEMELSSIRAIYLSSPIREKEIVLFELLKKMKKETQNSFLAKKTNKMKISYFHSHKENRKPTYEFIFDFLNSLEKNDNKDEYLNLFFRYNEINAYISSAKNSLTFDSLDSFFKYRQTIHVNYIDANEFYLDIPLANMMPQYLENASNVFLRVICAPIEESSHLWNYTIGEFIWTGQIYELQTLYKPENILGRYKTNCYYYFIKSIHPIMNYGY